VLNLGEPDADAYAVLRRETAYGEVKWFAGKESPAFVDVLQVEVYAAGEILALLRQVRTEGGAALSIDPGRAKRSQEQDGKE
jgi:hypothetical protein